MTVNPNEMLSALVDGELHAEELEYTLQLIDSDQQAKLTLQRYQLISDVLNDHVASNYTLQSTSYILAALAAEPAHQSTAKHKAKIIAFPKQMIKQLTGLAIAASVGALAVISVVTTETQTMVDVPIASVASPESRTIMAESGNRWTVGEPEIADRLNTYLVDHNEYAGAAGVFSYARVVSYDAGR